ncbi:hypothetical protein RB195_005407 [Necator americanus]|uniref:ERCC1-like central domain-containing protein n=1 Tax=Necator americanus TaxID=51031 RepID=A0ABR1BMQ1_NECAM
METATTSHKTPDQVNTETAGASLSRLVVNRRRQEGNPVLKYVRNVRYEWGDIATDFECGPTCGVLYLALKYHKLHPNYILTRLSGKDENKYACRIVLNRNFHSIYGRRVLRFRAVKKKTKTRKILLALCNVDEPTHTLRELNLLCYRMDWTMVLCYSVEEAAEYIENLKLADTRDATFKKPVTVPVDERTTLQNAAVGLLTGARSVTKADAQRLLYNFGSLKAIAEASEERLALCPGLGPIRAKNLYNYLRTPFTT